MIMTEDVRIIQLPKKSDPRGNLSIIEQNKQIPFEIKRVHWVYDVPGGFDRGGHAYFATEEFIVALSGSFDVVVDDGAEKKTYQLNRSYFGLYVPKGMWRTMTNFSTNSLALVLSSTEYNENDYISNYEEFKTWRKDGSKVPTITDAKTSLKLNNPLGKNLADEGRSVFDCSLCELNKMHDAEGNLTFMYENVHVPFPINRVFYSYDIPGGESRGAHAHKKCHQFLIAASGSFEVALDDGAPRCSPTRMSGSCSWKQKLVSMRPPAICIKVRELLRTNGSYGITLTALFRTYQMCATVI